MRVIQVLCRLFKSLPDDLPMHYAAEGWRREVAGDHVYRVKMLCQTCIVREVQRETLHRNYLKAKEAARRKEPTYNSLLMKSGF
jgi:hypothetical protein